MGGQDSLSRLRHGRELHYLFVFVVSFPHQTRLAVSVRRLRELRPVSLYFISFYLFIFTSISSIQPSGEFLGCSN